MALKKLSSKKIIIMALIILTSASAGAYVWWRNDRKTPTPPEETTNIGQPTTRESKSEGQKIDVPEDVPKDSIKNYELITENEQFKIRKLDNTYTVTLYAIINRPDQRDWYLDQLKEFKQNALSYLRDNKIDPSKVKIIYEPEEAKDL